MAYLRVALWNANGVSRHKLEIAQFINVKEIDVMLLAETHLTNKHNFQIRGYLFYSTSHPDGRAKHNSSGCILSSRFAITAAQFMDYFNTLGEHFKAAGDYISPCDSKR